MAVAVRKILAVLAEILDPVFDLANRHVVIKIPAAVEQVVPLHKVHLTIGKAVDGKALSDRIRDRLSKLG